MSKRIFIIQFSIIFFAFAICFGYEKDEKVIEQSEEFLLRAVEFHRHLGPYLVLGLKAGLYANQVLGREPMKTKASIKTKTTPPQSCFADGVQFSTGCTLGKGNISLSEGEGLVVTFEKNNQILTLKLRKEITEEINSLPSEEKAWENLANDLYQRKIEEIFEVVI